MKKFLSILLVLTFALCAFCACGSDKDEDKSASKADSAAVSAESSEETGESLDDGSQSGESLDEDSQSSEVAAKSHPTELVGTWYGCSYISVGETLVLEADGTGRSEYESLDWEDEFFDWYVDSESSRFYLCYPESEDGEAIELEASEMGVDTDLGSFYYVIDDLFGESTCLYSREKTEFGGDSSLVGAWLSEDESYIFSFYDDGSGDYKDDENVILFTWIADSEAHSVSIYYEAEDMEPGDYPYSANESGIFLTFDGQSHSFLPYTYEGGDNYGELGGDDSFVGYWTFEDDTESFMDFFADGTGQLTDADGVTDFQWFTKDAHIVVVIDFGSLELLLIDGDYVIEDGDIVITEEDEEGVYVTTLTPRLVNDNTL